jgi:hypothetical protein
VLHASADEVVATAVGLVQDQVGKVAARTLEASA